MDYKFDNDINYFGNELNLLILRIISIALQNNDHRLLSSYGITSKMAGKLKRKLLIMGVDQQLQLIRYSSGMIINFSIKEGAFNSQKHEIIEQRQIFRSDQEILSYEINYLLMRMITMAVRLNDTVMLDQFGIQREQAKQVLNMGITDQLKMIRDCSASKSLAINVSFNIQSFDQARHLVHRESIRNSFIDKLLIQGATYPVLNNFEGLTKPEIAQRRKSLGLQSQRGAVSKPDRETELLLEEDWLQDISYFNNEETELIIEWNLFHNNLIKYYVLSKKYKVSIASLWAYHCSLDNLNKCLA